MNPTPGPLGFIDVQTNHEIPPTAMMPATVQTTHLKGRVMDGIFEGAK
jgi:hypothetical protein